MLSEKYRALAGALFANPEEMLAVTYDVRIGGRLRRQTVWLAPQYFEPLTHEMRSKVFQKFDHGWSFLGETVPVPTDPEKIAQHLQDLYVGSGDWLESEVR